MRLVIIIPSIEPGTPIDIDIDNLLERISKLMFSSCSAAAVVGAAGDFFFMDMDSLLKKDEEDFEAEAAAAAAVSNRSDEAYNSFVVDNADVCVGTVGVGAGIGVGVSTSSFPLGVCMSWILILMSVFFSSSSSSAAFIVVRGTSSSELSLSYMMSESRVEVVRRIGESSPELGLTKEGTGKGKEIGAGS